MAEPVSLGVSPISILLRLNRGSDFGCILHSNSGDWPDTAEISIQAGSATWEASLDGPDAAFSEDLADVDSLIEEAPSLARLWYEDGAARILWGMGRVAIDG